MGEEENSQYIFKIDFSLLFFIFLDLNQRSIRMLKLEAIFQFIASIQMKSRLFLEFVSSQFIATVVGAIYQCSIVDYTAVSEAQLPLV